MRAVRALFVAAEGGALGNPPAEKRLAVAGLLRTLAFFASAGTRQSLREPTFSGVFSDARGVGDRVIESGVRPPAPI